MKRFKLKQYVTYPGHGIGQITNVETYKILGVAIEFYRISMNNGMQVLVPCSAVGTIGLKGISV